jgi:uncharacterized protein (TIGR00269 family)
MQEKVLKNIRQYKLIERGDKILIALSGGKDSIMTLDVLKTLENRHIVDLIAVTIDEGISGYRREGVEIAKKYTSEIGVEHRVVSFKEYLGITLDEMMIKPKRGACTYCGVFRRWILNKVAKEENATKIATGHNLDDETQSILMNYLEGNIANITRIGPKSSSSHPNFTIKIKPLREIPEKEVALYVLAKKLPVHFAGCPYAGDSFRAEVGRFIKELSSEHPTIMYSTLRGFDRIKSALQKEIISNGKLDSCIICSEPASGGKCKACTFLSEWNMKPQHI